MTRRIILLSTVFTLLYGCISSKKVTHELIGQNKTETITQGKIDSLIEHIYEIHPDIYMGIDSMKVDAIAKQVAAENAGKLMSDVDFTLQMRRITDLFNHVDPHLIYYPSLQVRKGFKGKYKHIKVFPFETYNINDTLIIKKSYVDGLKRGDMLLNINGYSIDEYQKYIYSNWRSVRGYVMQLQSQLSYAEDYKVRVNRRGVVSEHTVKGVGFRHATNELFASGYMIDKYKTGYCKIIGFTGNKFIYKRLKKLIAKTKHEGYNNFIIDLRGNTGGSGEALDMMFSLMSDKDSLHYMKSQYIKVSEKTESMYDFLNGHKKGDVVRFPDDNIIRYIPLDKELYQGDMNYYLIVDKSTASVAASFANIFQYNNIGKLVGEPLDHNSLSFGDIIKSWKYQNLIISTIQYNENTKEKDGILNPDIHIPYIAKDHMNHDDPILSELLEIIGKKSDVKK
jgi:hypothetical protein